MHSAAVIRIPTRIAIQAAALRAVAAAQAGAENRGHAERLVDSLWEDLDALEAALVLSPEEWDPHCEPELAAWRAHPDQAHLDPGGTRGARSA